MRCEKYIKIEAPLALFNTDVKRKCLIGKKLRVSECTSPLLYTKLLCDGQAVSTVSLRTPCCAVRPAAAEADATPPVGDCPDPNGSQRNGQMAGH